MWTNVVGADPAHPATRLCVIAPNAPVVHNSITTTTVVLPLHYFNRVSIENIRFNYSTSFGSVPPFFTGTLVSVDDTQAMLTAHAVCADWHRYRMTMTCVENVVNVNRDSNPLNPPITGSFALFVI